VFNGQLLLPQTQIFSITISPIDTQNPSIVAYYFFLHRLFDVTSSYEMLPLGPRGILAPNPSAEGQVSDITYVNDRTLLGNAWI